MVSPDDLKGLEALFGPVIHRYTRAQALEDGQLVDVTEWASARTGFMGGFVVPVALTRKLWADIEAIPETPACQGMDIRGRAHDVLYLASLAALAGPETGSRAFRVILPVAGSRKRLRLLHVHSGPGDDGEHVVTIGYPEDM